ncbi:hypothetical protein D3C78_1405500 [compost metagenome]
MQGGVEAAFRLQGGGGENIEQLAHRRLVAVAGLDPQMVFDRWIAVHAYSLRQARRYWADEESLGVEAATALSGCCRLLA